MIRRPLLALVVLVVVLGVVLLAILMRGKDHHELVFPRFDRQKASRIVIEGKEKKTVLEKKPEGWVVVSEHSLPVEEGVVDRILDVVTKISRKDIVSTNPEKRSLYQVDSSGILVRIEDQAGLELASFVVGKTGPDYASNYVRSTSSDEVVLLPTYLHPVVERGSRPWEDLALWHYDGGAITDLEIVRPDGKIVISKAQDGSWYTSEPESMLCDSDRVSRIVRTLCYLRADEIVGRRSSGDSEFSNADSSAAFRLSGGNWERLLVGSSDEKNRVLVMVEGRDVIYAVPQYKIKTIMVHLSDLKIKSESGKEER